MTPITIIRKNFKSLRVSFVTLIILLCLLNEFTLVYLDPSPPLSDNAIDKIRLFDLIIVVLGFSLSFKREQLSKLKKIFLSIIGCLALSLVTLVLLDITLRLIGFGYPRHYEQENFQRFPSPGDSFTGKPQVYDHNQFGFRGKFLKSEELSDTTLSIAFFGGSTGYNGNPPIAEIIRNKFIKEGRQVVIYNFSSLSSNHTQHIHRLLKFYDKYSFDIVIFYGGNNETIQHTRYDPRPGYPYNFFFRNELTPLKQMILRYSAIFGEIDKLTGVISGLKTLQDGVKNGQWMQELVQNYWRDIKVAMDITSKLVSSNSCSSPVFLAVLQPANPFTEEQTKLWEIIKSSTENKQNIVNFVDLTNLKEAVVFTDTVHVDQKSRDLIAKNIHEVLLTLTERC